MSVGYHHTLPLPSRFLVRYLPIMILQVSVFAICITIVSFSTVSALLILRRSSNQTTPQAVLLEVLSSLTQDGVLGVRLSAVAAIGEVNTI